MTSRARSFNPLASHRGVGHRHGFKGLRSAAFLRGLVSKCSYVSPLYSRCPPATTVSCVGSIHDGSPSSSLISSASTSLDMTLIAELLPPDAQQSLLNNADLVNLIEVVLDFGSPPRARFPDGDVILSQNAVSVDQLREAVKKVGAFGQDNRAGINQTLHRISCLRNRHAQIIGLTCRVGRSIPGCAELVDDMLREGKSILLLGVPGSGKTTAIRDMCQILSDDEKKRVIVVDTSNEIAGDGDVPHTSIGSSRRLQVSKPILQHDVMIEAVENHTPQVIAIDEIGTLKECQAAQTIARRGVQLIASAHGKRLAGLMEDPVLQSLMGGTQSVILGDEEASRRINPLLDEEDQKMRKTVIERKHAPTFDVVIEMVSRNAWIIYSDTTRAVDRILNGLDPPCEQRVLTGSGQKLEMICDADPHDFIQQSVLPKKQNGVGMEPLNCYAYSGKGDMHPTLVVRILQASTCEEVLQSVDETFNEGATAKDIQYALKKATIDLHPTTSTSSYAKVAWWKVQNACKRLKIVQDKKQLEKKKSQ